MWNLIGRARRVLGASKVGTAVAIDASIPENMRIYAIGDVHGRADLLEQVFAKIDAHNVAMPIEHSTIILLGDYVDRGLRSRDVIEYLIKQMQTRDMIAICGNHEEFMLRAFSEPAAAIKWLAAGGRETLYSYDVVAPASLNVHNVQTIMSEARERIPPEHLTFLTSLSIYATAGEYAFVHAGIQPGVALEDQTIDDLTSIRDIFLNYRDPHEYLIVHGHTAVNSPEFRSNRINIDTGAYITGKLTCLVLEGTERYIL